MKISDMIAAKQKEIADADAAKRAEVEAFNKERMAQIDADFKALFGEMYKEIIASADPIAYDLHDDGRISCGEIKLSNDDLELCPMRFVWSTTGKTYCHVIGPWQYSFDFSRRDVSIAYAFLLASQGYPKWKALKEQEVSEKIERLISAVRRFIFAPEDAEKYVLELESIDPESAAKARSELNKEIIEELGKPWRWEAGTQEKDVLNWYRILSRADQSFADERLALYNENVATAQRKQAEREAEEERQNQLRAQYRADCTAWAESETARIWQPFTVICVRYAPIGYNGSSDEDAAVLRQVYAFGSLENVVAKATTPGAILDVYAFGKVQKLAIGAFLDAHVAADFGTVPGIGIPAKYHATRYAGGCYVNFPPFIEERPTDPPVHPLGNDDDDIPL